MEEWTPPNSEHPPPRADEPALFRAARTGDDREIRRLVESGIEIDQIVDIRLDGGAREQLATPLLVAAGSGDGATVDTVRLLLELGASTAPPGTRSVLSFACSGLGWNYLPGGDAERLALLLDAGCALDRSGPSGALLLADVAGAGDPERMRLLLAAGADPAPAPETLQTDADKRRLAHLQRLFRENPDTREPPPAVMPVVCSFLALHRAAASGSEECVQLLLEAGAPARDDGADHSVLACATSNAILTALLAAGADPLQPSPYDRSIAEKITQNRRVSVDERTEMLRSLAAAGVDLDAGTPDVSAISSVAMSGNADAVGALLAVGADPRVEPNAMGFACFSYSPGRDPGMERTIDLLVAAGFDPDERDEWGYGPLHAALMPLTFGRGYCSSDGIGVAAAAALIRNGASIDITFPNYDDYRPLHIAAQERSTAAIEVLVAAGADIHQRTPAGLTPLDVARAVLASDEQTIEDPPEPPAELRDFDRSGEYARRRDAATACVRLLESLGATPGDAPEPGRPPD